MKHFQSGIVLYLFHKSFYLLEVQMVLKKKIKTAKKGNSFFLLGIYFFLISLTSFHFHPINLAGYKSLINKAPVEKSSHHYTAEECPILSFANNGFHSSLGIKTIPFSNNASSLIDFSIFQSSYKSKLHTSVKHRGPPNV